MKYTSVINGDIEGVKWACEIEDVLRNGNIPEIKGIGLVRFVAWPTVNGEPAPGNPMFLMEGSVIECLRNCYLTFINGKSGFKIGWPKNIHFYDP